MFFLMLWNTYLIFSGAQDLKQTVTLLWTFKVPWHWAYHGTLFHEGVAQFAFGFYSVMLTSTILGFITMVLFKPRSWCVYCPMGTMTQLICKAKNPHWKAHSHSYFRINTGSYTKQKQWAIVKWIVRFSGGEQDQRQPAANNQHRNSINLHNFAQAYLKQPQYNDHLRCRNKESIYPMSSAVTSRRMPSVSI